MKQRTQKEKEMILAKCLEIEAAGGDVIEYLRSEHYISPEATWHNMQKYDLLRNELTDGKPIESGKRKRLEGSGRKLYCDHETLILEIIDNLKIGIPVHGTILSKGYRDTYGRYKDLKKWTQENRPDLYDQLMELDKKTGKKKKGAKKMPEKKQDRTEESGLIANEAELAEEPQPEAVDYTSVIQELPKETSLKVVAVRGRSGIWESDGESVITLNGSDAVLVVDQWRRVLDDLPEVLRMLARS